MIDKLLGFIPLPYKLVITCVIAVAIGAYGFSLGYAWNKDDLDACESTVDDIRRISDALETENERIKLDSEKVTRDVSERWADVVAFNKRNPTIVRVRDNCEVPVPNTTTGIDGRPTNQGLGSAGNATLTASQCEKRLNDALGDAAQLMALQEWVRKQNEVTK